MLNLFKMQRNKQMNNRGPFLDYSSVRKLINLTAHLCCSLDALQYLHKKMRVLSF